MTHARGRFLLLSLIVGLIAGLMFTPGLPGGFVFDDVPNLENNAAIKLERLDAAGLYQVIGTPQMSGSMRTLPTLTFALDYWRSGGADPATFRTTNMFIHAVTAFALAWLFLRLLLMAGIPIARARWVAPALALAWAVHPLQVSSVLYAVQRLQTMGTFFLVLALLAYLQARNAQMEGQPARTWWMLTALLWVLAMGCKEDSILLVAYSLALELTLLQFRAADTAMSRSLRRVYSYAAVAGTAAFLFLVVPHYWSLDGYGGERDFSTPDRLLTQARVLCLYLWQIVVPLPGHMPFYYDWILPSRGLLHPWSTLLAIVAVLALLGTAWKLRTRWPLFSLGVLLFFAAHFITSNVIGLELAFEHRNHFALIGAVLAIGSLLARLCAGVRVPQRVQAAGVVAMLAILAIATASRSHDWRSNVSLAKASTESAPTSGRAWIELCAAHFKAGGGAVPGNPKLDQAIAACESGLAWAPDFVNNAALLIILKSLRGDIAPQEWIRLQEKLKTVVMTRDNQRAIQILIYHSRNGVNLDKQQILQAITTQSQRVKTSPFGLTSYGYFIMNDMGQPDLAMPYFMMALREISPNDPFPRQLASEMREMGRPDLAKTIEQLGAAKRHANSPREVR